MAPAFPHPIPQYVLDQIAFAEQQKREAAILVERGIDIDDLTHEERKQKLNEILFRDPEVGAQLK